MAVTAGNLLFVSGQLGIDPDTGDFAGEEVVCQVEQAFRNIQSTLGEFGLDQATIVKGNVFLKDSHDFAKLNDVYQRIFEDACPEGAFPARTTIESPILPKNGLLEIGVVCFNE